MKALEENGMKVGNFHEVPPGRIATVWDVAGNPLGLFEPESA